MDLSIFEIMMLICFGLAWPVSIWKSWHSRTNGGKSPVFLVIVCLGYVAGVLHKLVYHYDAVIWLYFFNGTLVFCDLLLYVRNSFIMRKDALIHREICCPDSFKNPSP
ncbi:hypothetical protein LZ24_02977 [Desulfobotulus alkaliphilus]|uniref:PQ loop repeat protein n=1 Tax=Desulfobotulus alkaliphilus TaxID=622671 RepID=A0A562R9N5_9BACT|nr:hypothetical protein [Desulfobotulus alkaliphilus]TWI65791.1 hypothetical protein LZ24_02977 [Desulfobotulus alkaliphilus]